MELITKKIPKISYVTVFTTGAVILILEILGSRILATTYGNTVFVWSAMIGITIISLAIGYYIGGKKRNLLNMLYYSTVIIFISSMSYKFIMQESIIFGVIGGSIISSVILFALPMVLLGTITPTMIKKDTFELKLVGENSGNILAIGTIGSFLGAMITGFIMIPNLTIPQILGITISAMAILTSYYAIKQKKLYLLHLLVLPIITVITVGAIQSAEGLIYETESMYGNIKVIETDYHRILLVDNAIQSMVEKGSMDSSIGFVQYSIIPIFYMDVKDVLIIGLGAGSISHEYAKLGIQTETVEIDPKIYEVATNYFDPKGKIYIDDARHFFKTNNNIYDVIIYDVTNSDSYPTHLFTKEAFNDVKQRLDDNGVLLINQSGDKDSIRIKSYYKTLSTVFEYVNIISFSNDDTISEMQLFIASEKPLAINKQEIEKFFPHTEGEIFYNVLTTRQLTELDGGVLVTDDYNPLDIMQLDVAEEWRKTIWESKWFE